MKKISFHPIAFINPAGVEPLRFSGPKPFLISSPTKVPVISGEGE
jgi:hypothetical protein